MRKSTILNVVIAMVVVLANLNTTAAHAASSTAAQLGPVWIGGGLTSGGTLTYQLNVYTTSPGTLTAKASIKSKAWKTNFPDLTSTPVLGSSLVESAPVTIPSTFTGPVKLRVKVYYNGKRVGAVNLELTVSAPPVVPPPPQTTWYDVGFSSNVTVNADAVSTNGLVPPLAYAWSVTDTDVRTNATFSTNGIAAVKFNTQSITTFGIDVDKQYDLDTNPNLVGIDSEQVTLSTYHLRVVVTDAEAVSKTGAVTVICSSVSPAQPTIPLGERQYLTAMPNGTNASTYSWTYFTKSDGTPARPAGSTAVIENPKSRNASIRPDKEGEYTLQLSVTGGGTSNSFVTVNGASFVGVSTCASCHGPNPLVGLDDYYTPWTQTKHSTFFQRAVDGLLSPYYNESCVSCHTVGYNKAPLASNDGFDDVQKSLGWKFPSILQGGNYVTIPDALKDKSNIQCESCHGPGSMHPGANSKSLDVAVCATCHQDGHYHNRPYQWKLGPHGADDKYLEVSIEEQANASCSKCHSPAGFIDVLKGETPVRTQAGRLTCQACHDPHNTAGFPAEAHQLRVYDTVSLDDSVTGKPITLTGQGTSATCMYCHHARRSPPSTAISTGSSGTRVPHESTATDMLIGLRACTNVEYVASPGVTNQLASVTLEESAHTGVAKCINCHMYNAGVNTVGDHTFSVTDRLTDEDNLAACQQCHKGVDDVTDFDHISVVRTGFPNAGDYDGNGVTEGVQTEVDGVMTNLVTKMFATGMNRGGSGGASWAGYSTNTLTRAVQRNAAWNEWLIERDLSRGVHNTARTIRLLQWTYTVLSTNTGGNAYIADFPNADLR